MAEAKYDQLRYICQICEIFFGKLYNFPSIVKFYCFFVSVSTIKLQKEPVL